MELTVERQEEVQKAGRQVVVEVEVGARRWTVVREAAEVRRRMVMAVGVGHCWLVVMVEVAAHSMRVKEAAAVHWTTVGVEVAVRSRLAEEVEEEEEQEKLMQAQAVVQEADALWWEGVVEVALQDLVL